VLDRRKRGSEYGLMVREEVLRMNGEDRRNRLRVMLLLRSAADNSQLSGTQGDSSNSEENIVLLLSSVH